MTASRTRASIIAAIAAIAAAGCEPESERCDPDQRYLYGLCYAIDAASNAPFGDVCSASTDCPTPTDFCAKQPADPTGYCTRTGCLADPGRCPTGWSCVDLSVFAAGLPAICAQP